MTDCPSAYLWINLLDLDQLGRVGSLGTPLNLMIRSDLGDELLDGAFYKRKLDRMDEVFVVLRCTEDRATAIGECLEMFGKQRMKRKVRTRITANPPDEAWKNV